MRPESGARDWPSPRDTLSTRASSACKWVTASASDGNPRGALGPWFKRIGVRLARHTHRSPSSSAHRRNR